MSTFYFKNIFFSNYKTKCADLRKFRKWGENWDGGGRKAWR